MTSLTSYRVFTARSENGIPSSRLHTAYAQNRKGQRRKAIAHIGPFGHPQCKGYYKFDSGRPLAQIVNPKEVSLQRGRANDLNVPWKFEKAGGERGIRTLDRV